MAQTYDLLVIGGGINGAGIARDAVGRGLSVLLCEQGDLAGATSSASSKLIHGGLRYLETYEFRLVREALAEREVLLSMAPHIIWPMRFVLPHEPGLRPAWLVRTGLFLYDHIGGRRSLPGTESVDFRRDPLGEALAPGFRRGFAYSDCWVEDSRLVVLNAVDAKERGAEILTRTRCNGARRTDGLWEASIQDVETGSERRVRARALVNAAGPWVGDMLGKAVDLRAAAPVRLVKGSHIIVPRLHDDDRALILQNTDRRVVFVIPFEGRFSLVGTTDIPFADDPAEVAISGDETQYLCDLVNRVFRKSITKDDVVHSFSGVRPLYDDGAENASKVTRDYVLDLRGEPGEAPLISIFGGKITTYRRLAEHALEKLAPYFPAATGAWTAGSTLPGGDLPQGLEPFLADFSRHHPWLAPDLARRLCRLYGTRADRIVADARGMQDLGESFGAGLTEAELDHLTAREFARTAEDVLWRRTRLGLHIPQAGAARLAARLDVCPAAERRARSA